jgi:hypothetical protein
LPGIDLEVALRNLGGNRAFLRRLLRDFAAEHAEDVQTARSYLERGEGEGAARTVHTYTVEAPTRFAPDVQLAGLEALVRASLHEAERTPGLARASVDRLARYRRADGTLDWKRLGGERALREVGGLAHFGLALFLKELALVAQTGDRVRIEEFFDGLLTTDFYQHYGLFVVGARAGELAYTRYLERFVKPRFVNGVLKTNLVLAAGLALPQLVDGSFSGRTLAISLTSLGLSATAVRAGARGLGWVYELGRGPRPSGLAGLARASRLTRAGGWLYTVAELAVVLYAADAIEQRIQSHLDHEAACDDLAWAGLAFLEAVSAPDAAPDAVRLASDAYHQAWTAYRDHLYRPLHLEEARLARRLEPLAREAKRSADQRAAIRSLLARHPLLGSHAASQAGSVPAYAKALTQGADEALRQRIERVLTSYQRAREQQLEAVYRGPRRPTPFLGELADDGWLLRGARAGQAGDPWTGRGDLLARRGRAGARADLRDALAEPSRNRLQAYEDELAVLEAARRALQKVGRDDLVAGLDAGIDRVRRTQALDQRLIGGDGVIDVVSVEQDH